MTRCSGCGNYIPIKDEVCYHCQPNYIPVHNPIEVKFKPIDASQNIHSNESNGFFKKLFRRS